MTQQAALLLSELDDTLGRSSSARRALMLRQVTDLLLAGELAYSQEHLRVFDAVMQKLTEDAEPRALIELSARLATIDSAPIDVVIRLSRSADVDIYKPVLENSNALDDEALVGIANSMGQGHLLAIAARVRINGVVTDVLVDRGNKAVRCKVTANAGAEISERGFARLITESKHDQELAALVVKRKDIPAELEPFVKLITTVSAGA
jgi:uncharacterized protein (DUF2336 family)